jgi:hypothetical protein
MTRDNRRMASTRFARTSTRRLSVRARLVVAAGYLLALLELARWAHHGWPPADASGLWFYSAALTLLLSVFVSEPFYTSPRVALANSAALLLIAVTADRTGLEASKSAVSAGRAAIIACSAAVLAAAFVALLTESRPTGLNAATFSIARTFGSGYFLFGVAYVASVYAAFADHPERLTVLLTAALAFTWGPLERFGLLATGFRGRTRATPQVTAIAVEDPAMVVATVPHGTQLRLGQKLGGPEGATGIVVDHTQSVAVQQVRIAYPPTTILAPDTRLEVEDGSEDAEADAVVGYVAAETTMNVLHTAAGAAATATGIEEGRLVSVDIRGSEVLYQVIETRIREGKLAEGTHARFDVAGQKLGIWKEEQRAFDLIPWVPDPGSPVRLKTRHEAAFEADGIGFVPGTSYAIRYDHIRSITHNTAILGILGSGKTTLARELVCRNICAGSKVVVLDITGQYAPFFDNLVAATKLEERTNRINEALEGFTRRREQDEDRVSFGSRGEFFRQMKTDLTEYVRSDEPLRIYNPLAFNVTTIEGFARGGQAELLREASTVEKTSVIASALLMACASLGETEDARVCLVLEEAHSLAPEPSEGLSREDQRAVTATARSVLQGRKYGYGCLLITQRTANVTKTILNQCHTVFALRSYDATGIAFLANYLGEAYSRVLSSLPDFHAAAFGAGISSKAPIVIRLNDPTEFKRRFWDPAVAERQPDA